MLPLRPNLSNQIARAKRALDEKYGEAPEKPFLGWHARGCLPFPPSLQGHGVLKTKGHELNLTGFIAMGQVLKRIKDAREQRTKLEAYLDRGYGSCPLRNIEVAVLVENTLLFHEAERYRLCAWVVMPNHVHALFEVWKTPMSQILYTWKRFSATRANRILNASGRFWQKEYWDRYIRDEEHFNGARQYIESNPVKAGLCCRAQEWAWSSANPKWEWDLGDGNTQPKSRYFGHLKSKHWEQLLGAPDSIRARS